MIIYRGFPRSAGECSSVPWPSKAFSEASGQPQAAVFRRRSLAHLSPALSGPSEIFLFLAKSTSTTTTTSSFLFPSLPSLHSASISLPATHSFFFLCLLCVCALRIPSTALNNPLVASSFEPACRPRRRKASASPSPTCPLLVSPHPLVACLDPMILFQTLAL
jgi:hypothetical protein